LSGFGKPFPYIVVDSPETFSASIDKVIGSLDESVELLVFGEAFNGGEDMREQAQIRIGG
jgi:hypothetical protein